MVDIYNSADAYLNLSIEESYGLTCIEALACGTPCVAYDKTSLSELMRKHGGILVEKNKNSIVNLKKIIEMLNEKKIDQNSIDNIDAMCSNYMREYYKVGGNYEKNS